MVLPTYILTNVILWIDVAVAQPPQGSFGLDEPRLPDVVVHVLVTPQLGNVHGAPDRLTLQIPNQWLYHQILVELAGFVGELQKGLLAILHDIHEVLHVDSWALWEDSLAPRGVLGIIYDRINKERKCDWWW